MRRDLGAPLRGGNALSGVRAWGAGALAVVAVSLALVLGRAALLGLAVVVGVLATGELLRLSRASSVRPAAVPALGGTVALAVVAYAAGEDAPRWFPVVVASVFLLAVAELLARKDRTQVTRSIAYTVLPVMLIGLLGSYVLALRGMADGFRLALILVLMVAAAEGAPRLLPPAARTSGNRFGAAGAGTLAIGVYAVAAFEDTFEWGAALGLAVIVALAAPVGRLVAEMISEDLLRLEPGMRRADASLLRPIAGLLLSAPAFFYGFRLLGT